jgi:ABC-type polar amino acid transport system ATPase subunit
MFGRFKNSKDPVKEAVSMIEQLDLQDKGDYLARDLSGG